MPVAGALGCLHRRRASLPARGLRRALPIPGTAGIPRRPKAPGTRKLQKMGRCVRFGRIQRKTGNGIDHGDLRHLSATQPRVRGLIWPPQHVNNERRSLFHVFLSRLTPQAKTN